VWGQAASPEATRLRAPELPVKTLLLLLLLLLTMRQLLLLLPWVLRLQPQMACQHSRRYA
jgi:hypothetical protein